MADRVEIEHAIWSLQSPSAQLNHSALSGWIDVSQPQAGLRKIAVQGVRFDGHALAVSRATDHQWPLRLAEAYVRGGDLVAAYEPAAVWPYAPHIYWRAMNVETDIASLGALSLLVSVQTHLLDTCPRVAVTTELPADELIQIGGCIVWRFPGSAISYAEMMLPSDYCAVKIEPEVRGKHRVNWELFAEFLEKGVIRKARLNAVLLPRQHDIALATACYAEFAAQPLPLTT